MLFFKAAAELKALAETRFSLEVLNLARRLFCFAKWMRFWTKAAPITPLKGDKFVCGSFFNETQIQRGVRNVLQQRKIGWILLG